MRNTIAVSLALTASLAAHAGELYTSVGLPGLVVGYSNALNDSVAVRVDLATAGSLHRSRTIQAIDYDAQLRANRLALLADWFPGGDLRLTGGLTINDARIDAQGRGNGGTIIIGNTAYVAGPGDRFDAKAVYPHVMPYLGIGYGHAPSHATGWGVIVDFGLSFGKPTVTGSASGPLLSQTVSQQDVQDETNRVRDSLNKFHGIPQLSLGASYLF